MVLHGAGGKHRWHSPDQAGSRSGGVSRNRDTTTWSGPLANSRVVTCFRSSIRNPAAPASERYKALANLGEINCWRSAHPTEFIGKLLQKEPVLAYLPVDPMMDPPNLAFWDENQQQYVAYLRNWINFSVFEASAGALRRTFSIWTTPEASGPRGCGGRASLFEHDHAL